MHIDVTFKGLRPDELQNLLASIRFDYSGPEPVIDLRPHPAVKVALADAAPVQIPVDTAAAEAVPAAQPITRKRGRPRKEKDHGTPSRSEPAEAGASYVEPAGESAAGTSTPTLDDVRAALSKVMETKGAEACAAILKKFDAPRISALFAEQYGKFIEACNAA